MPQQVMLASMIASSLVTTFTLSPVDKSPSITLSGGDLIATRSSGSGSWVTARSTNSHTDGFYYFEAKCLVKDASGGQIIGIMPAADSLSNAPGLQGTTSAGYYYTRGGGSPQLYQNNIARTTGGTSAGVNNYGGFAVRVNASTGLVKVWCRTSLTAGWLGGGDPSQDYTPTYSYTIAAGTPLFAAAALFGATDSLQMNFGGSAFNMAIPPGAAAWKDSAAPTYADSLWEKVALLIPFTGVDGATTATDSAGRHSLTFVGNAVIDTDNAHFPSGAVMMDGVNDGVTVSDLLNDFLWATGESLTIEAWYEFRGFAQRQCIIGNYVGASPAGFMLSVVDANTIEMRQGDGAGVAARTVTTTLTANALHHIAFTRNGATNTARLWSDGVQAGADITTGVVGTLGRAVAPGIGSYLTSNGEIDGWLRYLRITRAERYTATFTPPSTPYPTV